MKFSKEKPPVYEACHEKFGVSWSNGIIFTYGDTIHCKFKLHPQKIAHESVHVKQQLEYGVEKWWERYLIDEQFRLEQELQAYGAETIWIQKNVRDFKDQVRRIEDIVKDLSSFTYGNIISAEEARQLLLKKKIV